MNLVFQGKAKTDQFSCQVTLWSLSTLFSCFLTLWECQLSPLSLVVCKGSVYVCIDIDACVWRYFNDDIDDDGGNNCNVKGNTDSDNHVDNDNVNNDNYYSNFVLIIQGMIMLTALIMIINTSMKAGMMLTVITIIIIIIRHLHFFAYNTSKEESSTEEKYTELSNLISKYYENNILWFEHSDVLYYPWIGAW